MKRIVQFAAILAIALLLVQPALAASACLFGPAVACVTGCPMAMGGMRPNCPMSSQMVASSCPMDCCSHSASQATEPVATADKMRAVAQPLTLAEFAVIPISNPALAAREINEIRGVSPPLTILNQVFRI